MATRIRFHGEGLLEVEDDYDVVKAAHAKRGEKPDVEFTHRPTGARVLVDLTTVQFLRELRMDKS